MKVNPNLSHLVYCHRHGFNAALEGSGRAGKTWAILDFIIWYCSRNQNKTINIIRETYNSFKTTLYLDFARRLPVYGIESKFGLIKEIQQFKLFGNTINFLGADDPNKFLGAGCDIFWCNEFLDIPKMIFDQAEQRCREMWIGDWNPKTTDHWVFELEKRNDVKFLRTTFRDNPFISASEKKKVLSYEPTPENIAQGTADSYMWDVYGLGKRAVLSGLIYNDITWIDEFPKDVFDLSFGMDIGHTNSATAIVKVGKKGNNVYLQELFYEPCDDIGILTEVLQRILGSENHIWADSAEELIIRKLRLNGITVLPAFKPAGSVKDGIMLLKSNKIHVVKSLNFQKEANNYKWREVGGIVLNEPVKGYDHAWDAARYGYTMKWTNVKD